MSTGLRAEQAEPAGIRKGDTLKVFVLNMRGKPLMPCSPAKARHMLKAGKAVVLRRTPFTISLTVATGETKQEVTLGVDAGAEHVGISATTEKEEVFASEVEGTDYQQGDQLGFWNVREYVLFRDGHVCQHCRGRSKDPILNVHHLESRKTGGDAPNNLITLCETCHKAYHAGKIKLKTRRGTSFRAEAFMGIMRRTLLDRVRKAHPELSVENTYGYLTKHKRIALGLPKTHCADAFCIAGNLSALRRGEFLYQRQTRKHNRQIHKCSILKGGVRKLHQAPFLVKGFRLFDKVKCKGRIGIIFGRRSSGYFDVRTLDGVRLSAGISSKKLMLLEKQTTFLTQLRKEVGASSPS